MVSLFSPVSDARSPKKTIRVESMTYTSGSIQVRDQDAGTDCGTSRGCVVFKARPTESFVAVGIQDAHHQPVIGEVRLGDKAIAIFCGAMDKPARIPAGAEVTVMVKLHAGPVHVCGLATGVPTTGEVAATFSNIP
jgi:hypothetical protein